MDENENHESGKNVLTIQNPVFNCYMLCLCLLTIKIMGVVMMTAFHRSKNKAFISPEDAKFFDGEVGSSEGVDRVRRAHMNDLENIPIFCLVALTYIFTEPPSWLAFSLFLLFTITRILHTIVYAVFVVPQPTRAILWAIGFLIIGFMAIRTAIFAFIKLI